jgi:hypothetical protein
VLGRDHPETLVSCNNLAFAFQQSGDPRRAIPLLQQTASAAERALGTVHATTLTCANNLAFTYEEADDLIKALRLYRVVLACVERSPDPGQSLARTVRLNLGRIDASWRIA